MMPFKAQWGVYNQPPPVAMPLTSGGTCPPDPLLVGFHANLAVLLRHFTPQYRFT